MKKHYATLIFLFCIFYSLNGLAQMKTSLEKFNHLVEGIWLSEGEWSNGQKFKQEVDFEWGLDHKIVKVQTYGTIDPKTQEYGLRNEGVRAYNAKDSMIQFWEFDIFGGITKGVCYFEGENLHYEYDYHGEKLKESWIYVDQDHYDYQIASLKDGKIEKIYMKSSYKRTQKKD
ncbi:hypothetical protein [Marinifilum caeruleilacunae]|uniref:MORN repeat variant n=1 Tax=Marinifilum caeruleilacunae TaxID=2499076 RepID=A0ABX1WTW3_9BACT|nr:hypothetical protein [Marinifilum caeruleilacunae]NOU59452.1 hypothetical protein [Marinifilum caeruleilacunae]